MLALTLFGAALAALGFGCSLLILIHAFRRSVGTGVMVLLIPCFMLFYAFTQFEHRRKGLIVASWLSCWMIAVVIYAFVGQVFLPPAPLPT